MKKIYELSVDYNSYDDPSDSIHTTDLYFDFEKGLIHFIRETLITFNNHDLFYLLFPDKKIPENLKNLIKENGYGGFELKCFIDAKKNTKEFLDSFKKLNEDLNNNFSILKEKIEKSYNDIKITDLIDDEFTFHIDYEKKSAKLDIYDDSIGNTEIHLNEAKIK